MKRTMLSSLVLASGAVLTAVYLHQKRGASYSFNHRVVVITGGSRGLGLAMARRWMALTATIITAAWHDFPAGGLPIT